MWTKTKYYTGPSAGPRVAREFYTDIETGTQLITSNSESDGYQVILNRPGLIGNVVVEGNFATQEEADDHLHAFMTEQGYEEIVSPANEQAKADAEAQAKADAAAAKKEAKGDTK